MDITTGLISIDHPEEALAAKTYEELREEHRERRKSQGEPAEGSLITFRGLPEGKDAYNPSGVFTINGEAFRGRESKAATLRMPSRCSSGRKNMRSSNQS